MEKQTATTSFRFKAPHFYDLKWWISPVSHWKSHIPEEHFSQVCTFQHISHGESLKTTLDYQNRLRIFRFKKKQTLFKKRWNGFTPLCGGTDCDDLHISGKMVSMRYALVTFAEILELIFAQTRRSIPVRTMRGPADFSLLTYSVRTNVLCSQIPPVSVCVQADSRLTMRGYKTGSANSGPADFDRLQHRGEHSGSQTREAEQEQTSRGCSESLLELREGRWCCGGRMKERIGLLLIHTYTIGPARCVHGPVVHFSCIHVNEKRAPRSHDTR